MTPDRLTEIASEFNNAYRLGTFDVWLTGQELVDIADLALDGITLRQMEQNEMNRDYFTKPIQGSRSQHDYGRAGPIQPMQEESTGAAAFLTILSAAIGGFVLMLMFFAWIS